MDYYIWTHEYWLTSQTYIHQIYVETGCRLQNLWRAVTGRDGYWEEESESPGNLRCSHTLMTIIFYSIFLRMSWLKAKKKKKTHHHVVLPARISLTLSRHSSLSFIASSRCSGLHPVSSHSCCIYVRAGRPAFARPYVGVHRSTSLVSSSPLLQQCPACLVRLARIVIMMGGRWPYSWCLVGCCRQDLFNIARSILV